ncbi:type I restriction-modification system subunit M N-terminal domain-containing protein [Tritonibacter mobilis]|uniref:type I restriction-modification system subunit M N-terminal domain-containing protein n=1 Tax=Tritonibacter mobilis TaxID=379347 RepID=UPI001CDA27B6|nr:type I restriction-modification system subunit M N-terminal domain-containing protein [Tritonibacter mobilis]MCA2008256.1 type I restriction-modification system subunit M N-terminal domain-containing protein [Tritonibacter mobilis]
MPDAVLEEVRYQKEDMGALELDDEPLKNAAGYVFFNTSQWTLKKLHGTATNNQQILLANIEDYLDGFSDNVREIVTRFKLFDQMRQMADKQVLLDVIEKFVSPYINLTPETVEDPEGNTLPGLSNLGMGYVFEELIRKFNEENNEEAGEHFKGYGSLGAVRDIARNTCARPQTHLSSTNPRFNELKSTV